MPPSSKTSQFTAQHKFGDRKTAPSRGGGTGGGPSLFAGEDDCCGGGRAPRRSSGNTNTMPKQQYSPRGYSPKSPRFNTNTGQRFTASRTSGRFMHPMNETDTSRYADNMGPEGSRYGSKDCSRYNVANNSNVDQDMMGMMPKPMDQAAETTTGRSTN